MSNSISTPKFVMIEQETTKLKGRAGGGGAEFYGFGQYSGIGIAINLIGGLHITSSKSLLR